MAAGLSKRAIRNRVKRLQAKHPDKLIRVLWASNGEVAILVCCPRCAKPSWACSHREQWQKAV